MGHFEATPENKASELDKSSTYAKTARSANKGYNADVELRSEVHHIVCEISVASRFDDFDDNGLDPATQQYIEDCLWITPWDINNVDNLVGMPRNRRFRVDWPRLPKSGWSPLEWPSHQVDHLTTDGYTEELQKWLYKNVWSTVRDKRKKHEASAEKIQKALNSGSSEYHQTLMDRGQRAPGKIEGWENRHDPAYKKTWYRPFSMGKKPSYRDPGARGMVATGLFKKLRE